MRAWKQIAVLMAVVLVLSACASPAPSPIAPTSPPATEPTSLPPTAPPGVTAAEVQQMLAEKFNTANLDYSLWAIQPGLGTVMLEYGRRIALADLAVQAGDWGLAQHELTAAMEIQAVGETTRPEKADSLKAFQESNLEPLLLDVQTKDAAGFNTDFESTLAACNACHVAYGHPYVVVQPPTTSPEDFLALAASEPEGEEMEEGAPSTPTAAPDAPLTWEELYQMVDGTFSAADPSLALWKVQPGLATVMMEYGRRMAMVKLAADAGDWGMAQYQLAEELEIQEVGEATTPERADMLKAFEHGYLDALAADILAKDTTAFTADYSAAITGCNACHQAVGSPFVSFSGPLSSPEPFLQFGASEPVAAEEAAAATPTAATFPAGNPTREDAAALIDTRLNSIDRSLTLWNIQPGLGTVMMEYGYRFALAWQAEQAGNWGMAEYQLDEAKEIQEVGETTRPAKADMLKAFEQAYLTSLIEAAKAKDAATFEANAQSAVTACNACHQATGHPYVVVQFPPSLSVDFLNLH